MRKILFLLALPLIMLQSCNKSEEELVLHSDCGQLAVVDRDRFNESDSEGFRIEEVNLNGDCLTIEVVASGCSGRTWEADLIDLGAIAESYPIQRYMKLILENTELCNALISRKFTFDLTHLQTGDEVVTLNLQDWKEQITYEY